MGTLDAIRQAAGDDWKPTGRAPVSRENWRELCVCGHIDRYHAEPIGGTYSTAKISGETLFRGETVKLVAEFGGCIGAMPIRGFETETRTMDRELMVLTTAINPTCPCTEFRPVARVDRPNRYFNQRMLDRHPFTVGVGALATFLSRRKAALEDPAWADAEFERRFTWIEASLKCGISGCKATGDGCYPVYVNDARHSELRCARHRE